MIDFLHLPIDQLDRLTQMPYTGLGIDSGSLIKRFIEQLKNADPLLWYNVISVPADGQFNGAEFNGKGTSTGLTRIAVYEVDWKVKVNA